MIELQLDRERAQATLVEQLVRAFSGAIEQQALRAGALLPSVRQLAQAERLSTFTVTEAYGRLVSMGLVVARRGLSGGGAGPGRPQAPRSMAATKPHRDLAPLRCIRRSFRADQSRLRLAAQRMGQ